MLFLKSFEGSWFLDYRHGYGKYRWHQTSNTYEGMFFMNHREGYGTLTYVSGDLFIVNKFINLVNQKLSAK